MIFVLIFYSIVYCVYARKRIERRQEEAHRRAIEARYEVPPDSVHAEAVEESNEDSKQSDSSESNSGDSINVINKLIKSMKKTFTLNTKTSKDFIT